MWVERDSSPQWVLTYRFTVCSLQPICIPTQTKKSPNFRKDFCLYFKFLMCLAYTPVLPKKIVHKESLLVLNDQLKLQYVLLLVFMMQIYVINMRLPNLLTIILWFICNYVILIGFISAIPGPRLSRG